MAAMGVYSIIHTATGRCYIGSSVNIERRWYHHRRRLILGSHHSKFLQRAWNKYGADAFTFSIVESVADINNLLITEQRWLDTEKPVFNTSLTAGNTAGTVLTNEHKAKIAASLKGNTRCKGIKHSEEHRRKNSEANRGKVMSAEARLKISVAHKGKTVTAETRAKLSKAGACKGAIAQRVADKHGICGQVMSCESAAKYIGCSITSVRRLVKEGFIPAVVLDGCQIIRVVDLDGLMDKITERLRQPKKHKKGSQAYNSKLTEEQVVSMRADIAEGKITMYQAARIYGVSQPTVKNIVMRKKWSHI